METNPKKGLGIVLGVIAFVGIFFVSVASIKKTEPVPAPSTPAPAGQDASANPPATVPAPVVQNPTRGYSDDGGEGEDGGTSPAQKPVPVPAPATVPKNTAAAYKDGTYSVTGSYMSPGGYDQLGVSLTIKNDIVTAANVTNMAGDRTSSRFQNAFISGYKAYVIGQDISTLNLSRVSGASLTPQGFDDAVAQIKTQAKA